MLTTLTLSIMKKMLLLLLISVTPFSAVYAQRDLAKYQKDLRGSGLLKRVIYQLILKSCPQIPNRNQSLLQQLRPQKGNFQP